MGLTEKNTIAGPSNQPVPERVQDEAVSKRDEDAEEKKWGRTETRQRGSDKSWIFGMGSTGGEEKQWKHCFVGDKWSAFASGGSGSREDNEAPEAKEGSYRRIVERWAGSRVIGGKGAGYVDDGEPGRRGQQRSGGWKTVRDRQGSPSQRFDSEAINGLAAEAGGGRGDDGRDEGWETRLIPDAVQVAAWPDASWLSGRLPSSSPEASLFSRFFVLLLGGPQKTSISHHGRGETDACQR
ncbi:hypothetical protein G7Z17_g11497 [Cylindrodendrum hubeiense]|uniref:Uncharacterized protein n=1 Tax=Cylindrodendrum hubeiense TaxID=595255 RepID=A0A9P5H3V1_9HYPO|nr:hypothetical protein G7Z17_g11497 [Cylindrodendrum hubeiense]